MFRINPQLDANSVLWLCLDGSTAKIPVEKAEIPALIQILAMHCDGLSHIIGSLRVSDSQDGAPRVETHIATANITDGLYALYAKRVA